MSRVCDGIHWSSSLFGDACLLAASKTYLFQKQPPRGVLRKRCSENMQQIYRRTPKPKCDFNKVALLCNFIEITRRLGCSHVNLLHIFRTPFPQSTSEWLLLLFWKRQRAVLFFQWFHPQVVSAISGIVCKLLQHQVFFISNERHWCQLYVAAFLFQ